MRTESISEVNNEVKDLLMGKIDPKDGALQPRISDVEPFLL
jgi:hypothetical protein